MKHISTIIATMLALASCSLGPRVIEKPYFETATAPFINIESIEMTPVATVVHFKGFYRPGYWIRLDEEECLYYEGKEYRPLRTEGIVLGQELWMPESGDSTFTIAFEPLPLSAKTCNWNEKRNVPGSWAIFGIDLTGKKKDDFEGYPAPAGPVHPTPVMKPGEAEINVHLDGFYPEIADSLQFWGVNFLEFIPGRHVPITPEGDARIDLTLPMTTCIDLNIGALIRYDMPVPDGYFHPTPRIWVSPGESVDVRVDLRSVARMCRQLSGGGLEKSIPPAVAATGEFSTWASSTEIQDLGAFWDRMEFRLRNSWRWSDAEYADSLVRWYKADSLVLASADCPEGARASSIATLRSAIFAWTLGNRMHRIESYIMAHTKAGEPMSFDLRTLPYKPKPLPEPLVRKVLNAIGGVDDELLLCNYASHGVCVALCQTWKEYDIASLLGQRYADMMPGLALLSSQTLRNETQTRETIKHFMGSEATVEEVIAATPSPFVREVFDICYRQYLTAPGEEQE